MQKYIEKMNSTSKISLSKERRRITMSHSHRTRHASPSRTKRSTSNATRKASPPILAPAPSNVEEEVKEEDVMAMPDVSVVPGSPPAWNVSFDDIRALDDAHYSRDEEHDRAVLDEYRQQLEFEMDRVQSRLSFTPQ